MEKTFVNYYLKKTCDIRGLDVWDSKNKVLKSSLFGLQRGFLDVCACLESLLIVHYAFYEHIRTIAEMFVLNWLRITDSALANQRFKANTILKRLLFSVFCRLVFNSISIPFYQITNPWAFSLAFKVDDFGIILFWLTAKELVY